MDQATRGPVVDHALKVFAQLEVFGLRHRKHIARVAGNIEVLISPELCAVIVEPKAVQFRGRLAILFLSRFGAVFGIADVGALAHLHADVTFLVLRLDDAAGRTPGGIDDPVHRGVLVRRGAGAWRMKPLQDLVRLRGRFLGCD